MVFFILALETTHIVIEE